MEAKVYRHGSVQLNERYSIIVDEWTVFDTFKPAGRSGRLDSIFASPSLLGMIRWTNAAHCSHIINPTRNADLTKHEITVSNPESIYVYDVNIYEQISQQNFQPPEFETPESVKLRDEAIRNYWDSGIQLSQWEQLAQERNLNPMDWEVLVPVEAIVCHQEMDNLAVLEATPEPLQDNFRKFFNL